jgi:hypothetical protein
VWLGVLVATAVVYFDQFRGALVEIHSIKWMPFKDRNPKIYDGRNSKYFSLTQI